MARFLNDEIEYLVLRRFPFARALDHPPLISSRPTARGVSEESRELVTSYRAELSDLTVEELTSRLRQERAKEAEERRLKSEREENGRYFNQPHTNADFDYWSKAAHWTLDEAIALSFGKAPERVKWDNVQSFTNISPFAFQYARRRELALRAVQWKQLFDPVLPGIFLAWAKRNEILVPEKLIEVVERRGIQVADWKKLYEDSQKLLEEASVFANRLTADWQELVVKKDEFIERLKTRIETLEAANLQTSAPPEKSLGTRERESLLKLVIGMAITPSSDSMI